MRAGYRRMSCVLLCPLVFLILLSGLRPSRAAGTDSGPLTYLPLVPMEKTFDGLGGRIHVTEVLRPLPGAGPSRKVEVTRKIAYLNFPTRTIVSVYEFNPATGEYTKNTSTSAFSQSVYAYHPPPDPRPPSLPQGRFLVRRGRGEPDPRPGMGKSARDPAGRNIRLLGCSSTPFLQPHQPTLDPDPV